MDSEIENLKQSRFSLQSQLDSKESILNALSGDLEYQQKQYDEHVKKYMKMQKERDALIIQVSNLEKKTCDLEQSQENLILENSLLKKKVHSLQQELNDVQQTKPDVSVNNSFSQHDALKESLKICEMKNEELQNTVNSILSDLQYSRTSETKLTNQVKELEEGISERDRDIMSYIAKLQEAKDNEAELRVELDLLKIQDINTNKQGNSVYSELDDRRKMVEQYYVLLKEKNEYLVKKVAKKQEEVIMLQELLAQKLGNTSRPFHDQFTQFLEQRLAEAKQENEKLGVFLQKANSELQMARTLKYPQQETEHEFLRLSLKQAEKEVADWKEEWMKLKIAKWALGDQLEQQRHQLLTVQEQLDTLQIKHGNLVLELEYLRDKSELNDTVVECEGC